MAHISVIGAPKGSVLGGDEDGTTATAAGNSLAADTVDFLTTLSQGLADENDNLIALIRQTLSTLKTVQGLPDDGGLHVTQEDVENAENLVVAPPASFDALSDDLGGVLYSLKELLNQPNYVPVEELAERDAEIARLVAKNETIEEEWKKAIELVDGWNKTLGRSFDKERAKGSKAPAKERKRGQRALADIVNRGSDIAALEEGEKETTGKPVERETGAECANDDTDEDMSGVQLLVVEESKPAEPARRRSLRNVSLIHPRPQLISSTANCTLTPRPERKKTKTNPISQVHRQEKAKIYTQDKELFLARTGKLNVMTTLLFPFIPPLPFIALASFLYIILHRLYRRLAQHFCGVQSIMLVMSYPDTKKVSKPCPAGHKNGVFWLLLRFCRKWSVLAFRFFFFFFG